jgi:ATP-binding cassette, subfamily F, member 2
LHGLGFTKDMQNKRTREFSGGWRMRIALARALFVKPTMLLLDEPTNHLDLEACVWLEEYLHRYDKILVIISHSQDFMNGVCTNILQMQKKKVTTYSGNYDSYVIARQQLEENQMKKYNWEQEQVLPCVALIEIPLLATPDHLANEPQSIAANSLLYAVRPARVLTQPSAPGDHRHGL